jgi:hypothetical protein
MPDRIMLRPLSTSQIAKRLAQSIVGRSNPLRSTTTALIDRQLQKPSWAPPCSIKGSAASDSLHGWERKYKSD